MTLETFPFDVAEHLDPDGQTELLVDAFESNDATYIRHALNIVARARGMTSLAQDTGITREGLYKALGSDGDPRFSTIMIVLKALGLKLSVSVSKAA